MTGALAPAAVRELLARRTEANERFFAAEAERIARLCHAMAERFARGGRLLALGVSDQARSDARHVAVEFVHPVIVGKRALPALAIVGERERSSAQLELLAQPDDVAIAFGPETASALAAARGRGCLTLAGEPRRSDGSSCRRPTTRSSARSSQRPSTTCSGSSATCSSSTAGSGGAGREGRARHRRVSFLYPFLGETEHDLEAVVADVRGSVVMKAARGGRAPRADARRGRGVAAAGRGRAPRAARARRQGARPRQRRLRHGRDGRGGRPPLASARWPARAAVDLTEDPAILTAIANDVGVESIFQRQVIAYGLEPDALLALSTSGNSTNVIAALAEARRRGLLTVALRRLRRRPRGRRAARRPRGRDALGAHPADPGGAGERVARAQGADRARREVARAVACAPAWREWCRAWASAPTSTAWRVSWGWPGSS